VGRAARDVIDGSYQRTAPAGKTVSAFARRGIGGVRGRDPVARRGLLTTGSRLQRPVAGYRTSAGCAGRAHARPASRTTESGKDPVARRGLLTTGSRLQRPVAGYRKSSGRAHRPVRREHARPTARAAQSGKGPDGPQGAVDHRVPAAAARTGPPR